MSLTMSYGIVWFPFFTLAPHSLIVLHASESMYKYFPMWHFPIFIYATKCRRGRNTYGLKSQRIRDTQNPVMPQYKLLINLLPNYILKPLALKEKEQSVLISNKRQKYIPAKRKKFVLIFAFCHVQLRICELPRTSHHVLLRCWEDNRTN